jgi:death-on-curing protein
MEELTSNDILYLHSIVEEKFKIFTGVKDLGLVQAIADRPKQKFYGTFIPFDDIFTKAASLMEGIIRMHPFYDGNKRTALLSTIAYLELNGYTMIVPISAVRFTVKIAKNDKNDSDSTAKLIRQIAKWIKKLSARSDKPHTVVLKSMFYFILPLIGMIPISVVTLGILGKWIVSKWMAFDIYPEYEKESGQIISFIVDIMKKSLAHEVLSKKS